MGFSPSLDTYGVQDTNKKTRNPLRLLCFCGFFMVFFVKKKVAKKPVFCYDEIVQKTTQQRGAF